MQGSSRSRPWAVGTRSYRVERSKRALQLLVVLAFLLVMFSAMLYEVWHVAGGAGAVLIVPVGAVLVVLLVVLLVVWRRVLPASPAPLPEIEVPAWMTLRCPRCGTVTWWDGDILGEMKCMACGTLLTWGRSRDRRR